MASLKNDLANYRVVATGSGTTVAAQLQSIKNAFFALSEEERRHSRIIITSGSNVVGDFGLCNSTSVGAFSRTYLSGTTFMSQYIKLYDSTAFQQAFNTQAASDITNIQFPYNFVIIL